MREPMTEPFEPYESYEDDAYDWDVEEEPRDERPMNIKWGRVAALAGALLLAFVIGRSSASSGVPESQLTRAQDRAESLDQENEDLRAEVTRLESAAAQEDATEAAAEDTEGPEEPADEGEGESTQVVGEIYQVRNGDTLRGIAQRFYGDPELADFLADVNGIDDPTTISVGQKLTIPDEPPSEG
jgi:nucleoid-associated protein YgaU